MALPEDYWTTYEGPIASLSAYLKAVEVISAYQSATQSRFVWRGAGDASRPLHSSLVRRYQKIYGSLPSEAELVAFERAVLAEARDWHLDWHQSGGRLSGLELLAGIQHFGGPTRLIDFTFNPLIALWFAVEGDGPTDGRIFAIDVEGRRLGHPEADTRDPWWWVAPSRVTDPWLTRSWVWVPPPLEPRIVRQEGCFLVGGVPSTHPGRNVDRPGSRLLSPDPPKRTS